MTSDLIAEVANEVELRRGTGEVVGFRFEQGDSMDQRRMLINHQARVADVLRDRGWVVRVGVERPRAGCEIFAIRILDEDQPPEAA